MADWKALTRHPISAKYHDLAGIEWTAFVDTMRQIGFDPNKPIIIHDGMVLDGWQRQRACLEVGIEPKYDGIPDGMTPDDYVAMSNDQRRHESPDQRAERRERQRAEVIRLRAEGTPIRTIAETVGIHKTQVLRDLENSAGHMCPADNQNSCETVIATGHMSSPDDENSAGHMCPADTKTTPVPSKVKGKDGKMHPSKKPKKKCERCIRTGRDGNDCEACKELRRKPKKKADETQKPEPKSEHADDDKPWVDKWGIPITKEAAEAFKNIGKFDELLTVLRKAKKLYTELAAMPAGTFLRRPGVSQNRRDGNWIHVGIENAILAVKDNTPTYTVCPYAYADIKNQPHGKDCPTCYGIGWTPDINLDAVSKELIESAKSANGVQ